MFRTGHGFRTLQRNGVENGSGPGKITQLRCISAWPMNLVFDG